MKLILILISFLTYISEILSNDACKTKQCLTECGHVGYFHDVNKCQTCHCNIRKDCPPVRCQLDCLFGRKKDKKGCEYCHCQDPCEDGEKQVMHQVTILPVCMTAFYLKLQIICQIGSYCYATHDCEEELHCKIDTRCISMSNILCLINYMTHCIFLVRIWGKFKAGLEYHKNYPFRSITRPIYSRNW